MSQSSRREPDEDQSAAKAPDAFRTISEVAEDLDLPQHVLRFWETRFTQIKPLKRGGGRRYYRPQDVELLRGIRHLLYGEGYTIRGVQRLLREQGLRFVIAASHGAIETSIVADDDQEPGGAAAPAPAEGRSAERMARRLAGERQQSPVTSAPAQQVAPSLTVDSVRQLQGTLSELLECKRMLDAAR